MATISLKKDFPVIPNRIWKMGKIRLLGSKLKILDIKAEILKARIKGPHSLLVQIIEISKLTRSGWFRVALTLKFH